MEYHSLANQVTQSQSYLNQIMAHVDGFIVHNVWEDIFTFLILFSFATLKSLIKMETLTHNGALTSVLRAHTLHGSHFR